MVTATTKSRPAHTSDGRPRPNMPPDEEPRAEEDKPNFREGTARIDGPTLEKAMIALTQNRNARSTLAQEDKAAIQPLIDSGLMKQSIRFLLQLRKMDPEDREEFLAQIDMLTTFYKYQ